MEEEHTKINSRLDKLEHQKARPEAGARETQVGAAAFVPMPLLTPVSSSPLPFVMLSQAPVPSRVSLLSCLWSIPGYRP